MNRHAIAVALLVATATQGCSPRTLDARESARVSVADSDHNKDCWWYEAGKNDLAAVWLSPLLAGEVEGGFRFVNLLYHDPTCPRPFALGGNVACLNRADPVGLSNASVEFLVRPLPGKTWADVIVRTDIDVTVTRL